MNLLFDVGNTELKLGVADDSKVIKVFRFSKFHDKSIDELYLSFYLIFDDYDFKKVGISSVVPEMTSKLRALALEYLNIEAVVVEPGVKTGLKMKADYPAEVGADLICGSVAASKLGKNVLFIDLGTATKYVYVENNTLSGVVIAPGVEISMNALVSNTALLPTFELKAPKTVLGNNTVTCLQSGIIYGTAAQIEGLVGKIKKEVNKDFLVVMTGGLSVLFNNLLDIPFVDSKNLVLDGLLEILLRNSLVK